MCTRSSEIPLTHSFFSIFSHSPKIKIIPTMKKRFYISSNSFRNCIGVKMPTLNEAEVNDAMEKARKLITESKDYKGARAFMKTAINYFPDLKDVLEMFILCETLYYGEIKYPNWGIDWYSVLHLLPSATDTEVKTQCEMLISCTSIMVELERFPNAVAALKLLLEAKSVLCDEIKRVEYDSRREESGLIDFLGLGMKDLFKEDYLDWKPPIYSDVLKRIRLEKRLSTVVTSSCVPKLEEEPGEEAVLLFPKLKKLKNHQLFDEMPQRPHYAPLDKYTRKVREGMMIGLDISFIDLCEEIRKVEDPESFWSALDGFMEQLKQFEEMGYNVEKLRERLETLKRIAERDRGTRDTLEKFEAEVREHEAKIAELRSRIVEFEAQIEKSRVLMDKRMCKIDNLKKDLIEVGHEFASVAKSLSK